MESSTLPRGLKEVMHNLNKEINGIKGRSMEGLIRSAKLILRDTEATPPITPVDLGNLRASRFIVTSKGDVSGNTPIFKGRTPSEVKRAGEMSTTHSATVAALQGQTTEKKTIQRLYMGYSANYAGYVHENMNEVNWKRPNSGPKWFETAIRRNHKQIVETVRKYAKVK